MSWIVRNTLRNSYRIKQRGLHEETKFTYLLSTVNLIGNDLEEIGMEESFVESDVRDDLITIEKAIDSLLKRKIFSKNEVEIIDYIRTGNFFSLGQYDNDRARKRIHKQFKVLCDKIANELGGYFTNDGYIEYMTSKYNLSDEQIIRMKKFMAGRIGH